MAGDTEVASGVDERSLEYRFGEQDARLAGVEARVGEMGVTMRDVERSMQRMELAMNKTQVAPADPSLAIAMHRIGDALDKLNKPAAAPAVPHEDSIKQIVASAVVEAIGHRRSDGGLGPFVVALMLIGVGAMMWIARGALHTMLPGSF